MSSDSVVSRSSALDAHRDGIKAIDPPANNNFGRIAKVLLALLGTGGLIASTYLGAYEAYTNGSAKKFAACMLADGVSLALLYHAVTPPDLRRKINALISGWSYETLFAESQAFLNLPLGRTTDLVAGGFLGEYGFLQARDIATLTSLISDEFTQPKQPLPEEEELLNMVGFTTRNKRAAKFTLTAAAVVSVAAIALNFSFQEHFTDPLGKIGVYHDLVAWYSGSTLGEIVVRPFDDWTEAQEKRLYTQLLASPEGLPKSLKAARTAKKIFLLISPIAIGILFAPKLDPLGLGSFGLKMGVGGLYGINQFFYRRTFENPHDPYHRKGNSEILQSIQEHPTSCQKVKAIAKQYFPSIGFILALMGYMVWVATTNQLRADGGIIVMLMSVFLTFLASNLLAIHGTPQRDRRFINEMYFRLIYFNFGLSILFQYLTTKINIGDVALDRDKLPIYIMALMGWNVWGIVVGGNRAAYLQERRPPFAQTTPPITMQELGKLAYKVFIEPFA